MFVRARQVLMLSGCYKPFGDFLLVNLNHAVVIQAVKDDPGTCLISFTGYDSKDCCIKFQYWSDQFLTLKNHFSF